MSESNYWQIKIEVKTKDGSELPKDRAQRELRKSLKKFLKESFIEDYIDDMESIIECLELDGDRYHRYTALMDNLKDLKEWLNDKPNFNIQITEINDYLAERDE